LDPNTTPDAEYMHRRVKSLLSRGLHSVRGGREGEVSVYAQKMCKQMNQSINAAYDFRKR
jgi:hypothetical protein